MKKVVLSRHGESEWNRENRFTGRTDVTLNETGSVKPWMRGAPCRFPAFGGVLSVCVEGGNIESKGIKPCPPVSRVAETGFIAAFRRSPIVRSRMRIGFSHSIKTDRSIP